MDSVNGKGKCGATGAPKPAPARLNLEEVRERLREKKGPEFWRSLDELAATPEFQDLVHREFPRQASEWVDTADGVSRRRFLQLSSASLALAGLTGCTKQPLETIVPYVRQPEQLIPGKPMFFATALTFNGFATPVLAESHIGRPTKIEGNDQHPASLGATDLFAQASILNLYDPERSQTIVHNGRAGTWGAFTSQVAGRLNALQPTGGAGLRILTGSTTSPTLADQMLQLRTRFPAARWHRWEPAGRHQSQAAAVRAFGRPLETRYDFTRARVILAVGDALCEGSAGVRYAHDFAEGRRVRGSRKEMSRVYAVESMPTNISSVADHRLQLPPAQVEAFLLALAQALGAGGGGQAPLPNPTAQKWVQEVARDLQQNRGASLVVGDEYLSAAAQVLVHAINQALGNVGATVFYQEPVEADPVDQVRSITELVADMNAGQVEVLLVLDGSNPVYTAPADLAFVQAFQKVPLRVHHGLYEDETSAYCHWHIPAAHELESWGDARSFDGTVTLMQPLIEPLYGGKSVYEVVAALLGQADATGYDIVRQYWTSRLPGLAAGLEELSKQTGGSGGITTTLGTGGFSGMVGAAGAMAPGANGAASPAFGAPANQGLGTQGQGAAGNAADAANLPGQPTPGGAQGSGDLGSGSMATGSSTPGGSPLGPVGATTGAGATAGGNAFETVWRRALHAGLIPATASRPVTAAVNGGAVQQAAGEIAAAAGRVQAGQITLALRPDPTIWDGRYATNAWLQELPKPIIKLVWDNALILSPNTAERLGVEYYDVVSLNVGGRSQRAAVWVLPGMADDTALFTLGYGRQRAGKATGHGFNAYPLRTTRALWTAPGLQIEKTGDRYDLANTQNHHLIGLYNVHEEEEATEQAAKRHVIRTGTLERFRQEPDFIRESREQPAPGMTMYGNYPYDGHAWGMVIDLNTCTGCSACVVACQAENNIPSVGKDQVLKGREMHWLRIDRYFGGDLDSPAIHNQPLPCMHCENAPCEVVCPVAATVHSDEGLNDMVYNRCVGTRYCSNNCPYKVRRFNFLRYAPTQETPVLGLAQNPDVTVRMRGVMEKCTFCVQRIEQAKIESKVERQEIPPNWLQTACQQACPTRAITFGDLNDERWEVRQWKDDPLNYGLLEEINTRPRTTYLAKLRNPNPALEPAAGAAEGAEHGHA